MSDRAPTEPTQPATSAVLDSFHPAVRAWFEGRFPDGPTQPQRAAWPLVAEGRDVLVASPTGTGKTLTGFLVAIDAAYRRRLEEPDAERLPEVVYVSPLRALAVDVHENLQVPLEGIAEAARAAGMAPAGPDRCRPHRRHHVRRARRHAPAAARPAGHHPRVACTCCSPPRVAGPGCVGCGR